MVAVVGVCMSYNGCKELSYDAYTEQCSCDAIIDQPSVRPTESHDNSLLGGAVLTVMFMTYSLTEHAYVLGYSDQFTDPVVNNHRPDYMNFPVYCAVSSAAVNRALYAWNRVGNSVPPWKPLRPAYSSTKFTKQELDEQAAFAFLDKAIEKINAIVKQKAAIVDNIKEAAEKAFVARPDSPPEGCYVRAKAISLQPVPAEGNDTSNCTRKFYLPMEYNTQFENKYISMNESVAHVPTNVYDLSEELLTVANWTEALNSVFQQNAANDPTLRWQYFGSSTGFFKYYPGAMWNIQLDEPFLDFFDCRSQPWYLSASAYPKEMIIMVDKSGSMKGRNDIISNATVAEILNTLTENDYFNILMFSDIPKYADPAIDGGLLRATKFNKDHFIQKFKDFAPNGTASYERGLIEAFLLFNKSEKFYPNFHHCSRNIMIITDGAPASFGEIFDKYNPDKEVRVFAYLLGQHSSAEPYIEEMACNNRGYAVNIATLADVKENVLSLSMLFYPLLFYPHVQKYLDVVARSNVLLDDSYTIWTSATVSQFNLKELNERNFTNPYVVRYSELPTLPGIYPPVVFETPEIKIDTMIASREEEPVLYTSVARAVFDRSKKAAKLKQGNLLGVAGTDVPLQYFKDALRGWEIGPNNYLFAVDNNGFVLFHPAFRPVYKATLKSYYQNVDLNEIEIPEDVKVNPWSATPDYNTSLRQSVVDRERKVNEMRTYLITDNYVGKNLKEVNCALVEDLVNQSALTETFVFDFQGICIELREQVRNFSSRLLAPFYYLVRIVSKLIWEFTLFAIGLLEPMYPLPTKGQSETFMALALVYLSGIVLEMAHTLSFQSFTYDLIEVAYESGVAGATGRSVDFGGFMLETRRKWTLN
ncbi:unnamed protein product [Calicophoron daubneyi]|uniref:VWFA domain-containing protein n=1 Tax=Calicophoron daubneyi TaxID=300641 RepID=A0AAV2TGR5_CALDB